MFVCKLYARQRRTNSTVTSLRWSVFALLLYAITCQLLGGAPNLSANCGGCTLLLSSTCSTFFILTYVCTATSLHWSVLFVPIDSSPAVVSNNVPITRGAPNLSANCRVCTVCARSIFVVCTATSLHWSVLFVPIDPSPAVVSNNMPITQGQ